MEEEIEIRENFTPDILDRSPGWLMNWGVIAVTLGIISLLTLAAIIPYDRTIRFPVILGNEVPTYLISPKDGTILFNNLAGKTTLKKGDTLLVIATPDQLVSYIIAPCTGFTVYPDKTMINATTVTAGDTLVKILPLINTKNKVTAIGYHDELIPQDLVEKSLVTINIKEASGHTTGIKSLITYASLIPEQGKGYLVVIKSDSTGIDQPGFQTPVYHSMQAEAAIILKRRSIINWIFNN